MNLIFIFSCLGLILGLIGSLLLAYSLSSFLKMIKTAKMPTKMNWVCVTKLNERVTDVYQRQINCGYSEINSVDWIYIE